MCGIVGTVGFADETVIRSMMSQMLHRGPDDGGLQLFETAPVPVGFGFRRLAILDLTPQGHQPMSTRDERYWIVFNGEIYNYLEVRAELSQKGYTFRSGTDTEVILYAYQEWGVTAVTRLNGMWSFAIFDTLKKTLFISRDRLGEKPLYYTIIPGKGLAFASEIKSLLQVPGVSRSVNPNGILSTLLFLWAPEPETAFQGIYKLPAGHYVYLDLSNPDKKTPFSPTPKAYWSLRFEGYPASKSEPELIDELDLLLQDSVKRQMISDVPVGAFLSGGLDSSLITALMTKAKGEGITTYTIAFTEKDKAIEAMPDDQRYAKMVARHLKADYREIVLEPNITDMLPKMVHHLDEPVADPAAINTYLICKMAKDSGTTVMLSGMGGDEFFGGYRKHLATLYAETYKAIPQAIRKGVIAPLVNALPVAGSKSGFRFIRWSKRFIKSADLPSFNAFIGSYSYYSFTELTSLLNPDFFSGQGRSFESLYPIKQHKTVWDDLEMVSPKLDLVTRMCAMDTAFFLPCLNLLYSDKATMMASVEGRVPLVDYRVVEFAHRLPGSMKIRGSEQKYILKKVAERYLPREIVYRPKAPFSAPLRSWVKGDLKPLIDDLLSEQVIRSRGFFNPKAVSSLIANDLAGKEDNALRIWALLTLEVWMREFIDK